MASAARSSPAAHAPQASVHPQRLEREQRKSAGCERRPAAEPLRSLTILGRHRRHFLAEGREITTAASQSESRAGTTEKVQPPLQEVQGESGWVGRYAGFCHPLPLPAEEWRPSIYERRCRRPPAAYPDTRASSPRTCPVWPCSGWGLPSLPVTREPGLLHHRFTLTCAWCGHQNAGGLFSVALACGLPRVGVTHHPALRSPDVPRATCVARDRLANPSALQSTGVRRPPSHR